MRTEYFFVAAMVICAVVTVRFIDRDIASTPQTLEANETGATGRAQLAVAQAPTQTTRYSGIPGREVRITASRDLHYYVEAGINRRNARFLVDTGASFVALRESDARAAGIYSIDSDFSFAVRTANGETNAAIVKIDEVEISGIRIDGVKAFVLRDDQLAVNLLGMSFLNRLESVEARGGELILRG